MFMHRIASATLTATLLTTAAFAQKSDAIPSSAPAVTSSGSMAASPTKKNIVDTAIAAGQFQTLVRALEVAELADALRAPGPVTVFAPTDAAFAKIPKAKLDALMQNPAELKKVLTYHVVPGSLHFVDVMKMKDGTTVKTLNGKSFTVYTSGDQVHVDKALVTAKDIEASNGVIHVIDTVLLP